MAMVGMRTVTITGKGQISIPKELRKGKEFREGAKMVILAFNNRIELRPLRTFSESMRAAIASEKVLAKDWLSKEDEKAWKDL